MTNQFLKGQDPLFVSPEEASTTIPYLVEPKRSEKRNPLLCKFAPLFSDFRLPSKLKEELEIHYLLIWGTEYFLSQVKQPLATSLHPYPLLTRESISYKVKNHLGRENAELRKYQQVELSFRKHPEFPLAYVNCPAKILYQTRTLWKLNKCPHLKSLLAKNFLRWLNASEKSEKHNKRRQLFFLPHLLQQRLPQKLSKLLQITMD